MRTTVTLDPDVATHLQELAHRTRKPFKVVLNETIRQGIGSRGKGRVARPFRVQAQNGRLRPGWDDRRFNQLADELEIEEAARKLSREA